jgi:catechol 2,3-dioxygenase-like lactoylglutathione lyase family enzyme
MPTPVCELLGIHQPVVQAPMSQVPELAAAVSNAGALARDSQGHTPARGALPGRNMAAHPTTEVVMSSSDPEMVLAHFIVSDDVERSRRFYTDVLGGRTVISGESGDEVTYVALANSWIIINVGGGPTDDKPSVTLETQPDPDRVNSFLNIRVADIEAVYAEWSARGAQFLTPPKQHATEIRCYIRDPDGYLIEVGQTTLARGWRPPS